MQFWDYIVRIHETGDFRALVVFYGICLAVILFLALLYLVWRSRRRAAEAMETARGLMGDIRNLQAQVDEVERRVDQRVESRANELDSRVTRKMDQKVDRMEERIEQRASSLSDRIHNIDSRVAKATEDVDRFRERVSEVEDRIPNLFDRLDEFQATLSKTFQAELGSVLNSFDNSLAALLQQMKSDLELGLSRIEGIERMVDSREEAEQSLLGTSRGAAIETEAEEEGEFAEWEEEAKELAESPAEEETAEAEQEAAAETEETPSEGQADEEAVDEEEVDDLLDAIPVPEEEGAELEFESEREYPAEMEEEEEEITRAAEETEEEEHSD